MNRRDHAFDLEVLTAHGRIVDAVDLQGQRHHSFAWEMGIDLDTPIPVDQGPGAAIANEMEILHLLGSRFGQVRQVQE